VAIDSGSAYANESTPIALGGVDASQALDGGGAFNVGDIPPGERHGTTKLFAALDLLNGAVLATCKKRHWPATPIHLRSPCVGSHELRAPLARDEYQSYLPQVFRMVCARRDERDIADHLRKIVDDRMGLASDPGTELEVARLLLAWRSCFDTDEINSVPTDDSG